MGWHDFHFPSTVQEEVFKPKPLCSLNRQFKTVSCFPWINLYTNYNGSLCSQWLASPSYKISIIDTYIIITICKERNIEKSHFGEYIVLKELQWSIRGYIMLATWSDELQHEAEYTGLKAEHTIALQFTSYLALPWAITYMWESVRSLGKVSNTSYGDLSITWAQQGHVKLVCFWQISYNRIDHNTCLF